MARRTTALSTSTANSRCAIAKRRRVAHATATAAPVANPGTGGLASTGVENGPWLLLSGGALMLGLGALLIARSRREVEEA